MAHSISTRTQHRQEAEALLTIREVAQLLRVETTTVRRWIATGILDAVVLPHHGKRKCYRVQQHTLDQLLLTPMKIDGA
jgi:excisionase family DNA binding protein